MAGTDNTLEVRNGCSLIPDPGHWQVHCGIQKLTQTDLGAL